MKSFMNLTLNNTYFEVLYGFRKAFSKILQILPEKLLSIVLSYPGMYISQYPSNFIYLK
uniref:Uncharacterized protein n=1 Tax=Setaria italica TaxID=4555 RepID=K3ZFS0_SETIT